MPVFGHSRTQTAASGPTSFFNRTANVPNTENVDQHRMESHAIRFNVTSNIDLLSDPPKRRCVSARRAASGHSSRPDYAHLVQQADYSRHCTRLRLAFNRVTDDVMVLCPVADWPGNGCTPCLSGQRAAQALRSIPDRFDFGNCKAMRSKLREKFDTRSGF